MNTYLQRLEAVRKMMRANGWDAVVISASDPHSSEYPGQRWKQVLWLTGFAGECGDVVITLDHAGLWTDTRYFIQANRVLPGTGYELHKTRIPEQVLIPEWLACHAFAEKADGIVVAVDGQTQTYASTCDLHEAFRASGRNEGCGAGGYRIVNVPDMLDELWEDRPSYPQSPVITLGDELTGESRLRKIAWLRSFLSESRSDAILLTALDEIAWVLNARGSDIDYNPVIYSYLLVSRNDVRWYVKKSRSARPDDETLASFDEIAKDGVLILPYSDVELDIAGLTDSGVGVLYADPSSLNYNLYSAMAGSLGAESVRLGKSPVQLRKSIKNETEIKGMKEANIEDGVALERFFFWLENQLRNGSTVTEWTAAEKLQSYRQQIPGYMGDSFETISAYGPGAALPHYVTPMENAPVIEPHGLFLCDSGGQFLFGTTDTTRTVPCGPCTDLEKEDYTLVLKCHIDLSMAVFPKGTCGCHLDILVRNALWQRMRNFGHGSGHGVGFFLNVHEGPQEFRQNFNSYPYVPGIVNTNEPGIYREGMHGVRHENDFVVVDAGTNEFGTWYRFETITRCHIDTSAVIKELLSPEEIRWLNDYNAAVCRDLSPRLAPEIADWLREKCRPI